MLINYLVACGVDYLRSLYGIAARPYATYRRITDHGRYGELIYLGLMLVLYFSLVSVVKTAAFRPFLLTKQFILLIGGAGLLYVSAVGAIWMSGKFFGAEGSWKGLMLAWAYTLVPTWIWFFITSLLYVILPPPRTTSGWGMAFSIVYLVFSVSLFFWKIILGYLTLRFSLRLDLVRITGAGLLAVIPVGLVGWWLIRAGIFRVPFI